MRSARRVLALAAVAGLVFVGLQPVRAPADDGAGAETDAAVHDLGTPSSGGDPVGYVIGQQPYTTVYEPGPNIIAGAPGATASDVVGPDGQPQRKVTVSWAANQDVASATPMPFVVSSFDGGYTFTSGVTTVGPQGAVGYLRDGSQIAIGFTPTAVLSDHSVRLSMNVSTDLGKTWRVSEATFTTDKVFDPTKFNRGMRVNTRQIVIRPDGSLLMTYYTTYQGDATHRVELARSTDNGKTWNRLSTMAGGGSQTRPFNETDIAYTVDGDLVAVNRTNDGLWTERSTDDGTTWSTPAELDIATASGDPFPATVGVQPTLRLLPNGIMTLRFGRPDNWLAISPDGSGRQWRQAQTVYVNHPQVLAAYQRNHGSSGNGSTAVVAANRLIVTGDNCANSWGCPGNESGYTVDDKYRIWKRFVDVVGPGAGKIDLLGLYQHGKIKISTDLTGKDPNFPQMRPVAAIDGSTDWASSAVVRQPAGHPGTYTVTLDHAYTLTTAGLSLHPGLPSSATVEVSSGGSPWTKVVDTGTITSYALRYFPISGVKADRVRITVHDLNTENGRAATFLNEIELYSTSDSFENDPVETAPRGYTDCVGAMVTEVGAGDSRHVLRLFDAWSDRQARATQLSDPASAQGLQFRFNSAANPRDFDFIVRGDTAAAQGVSAYRLRIAANGSIGYYDSDSSAWTDLAPAGSVPAKEWHTIRVQATVNSAEVFLDGTSIGAAPLTTPRVSALTGHTFTSAGEQSYLGKFLLDDVEQTTT